MKEQTNIDLVIIDAIRKIAENLTEESTITHSLSHEIELQKDFWGRSKKNGTAIKKKILMIEISEQV